jgi:hypothetical protein
MKLLKFILFLCVVISITSCSDDETAPNFTLSSANLVGNYEMNSLEAQGSEDATSSSGATVNLTNTSTVGDTFQLDFALNANGTYTASGQYRTVSTITPNGGTPSEESTIIVINATGSYQLNSDNTVTFNPQTGDFFEGIFTIKTFNETSVILGQDQEEVQGNTTFTAKVTVGFIRA